MSVLIVRVERSILPPYEYVGFASWDVDGKLWGANSRPHPTPYGAAVWAAVQAEVTETTRVAEQADPRE